MRKWNGVLVRVRVGVRVWVTVLVCAPGVVGGRSDGLGVAVPVGRGRLVRETVELSRNGSAGNWDNASPGWERYIARNPNRATITTTIIGKTIQGIQLGSLPVVLAEGPRNPTGNSLRDLPVYTGQLE